MSYILRNYDDADLHRSRPEDASVSRSGNEVVAPRGVPRVPDGHRRRIRPSLTCRPVDCRVGRGHGRDPADRRCRVGGFVRRLPADPRVPARQPGHDAVGVPVHLLPRMGAPVDRTDRWPDRGGPAHLVHGARRDLGARIAALLGNRCPLRHSGGDRLDHGVERPPGSPNGQPLPAHHPPPRRPRAPRPGPVDGARPDP